jgi:hypothetical protein
MQTFGTSKNTLKYIKMKSDAFHISWQLDNELVLCIEYAPEDYPQCVYMIFKKQDYLRDIEEQLAAWGDQF